MNTEAVICIAFTRHSPSLTPLFRTSSSTVLVIFTKPRRSGSSNERYSVRLFMPELFAENRGLSGFGFLRLYPGVPDVLNNVHVEPTYFLSLRSLFWSHEPHRPSRPSRTGGRVVRREPGHGR